MFKALDELGVQVRRRPPFSSQIEQVFVPLRELSRREQWEAARSLVLALLFRRTPAAPTASTEAKCRCNP